MSRHRQTGATGPVGATSCADQKKISSALKFFRKGTQLAVGNRRIVNSIRPSGS
jgi:hypothetical protein